MKNKLKYANKRVAVGSVVHKDGYIEVTFDNLKYSMTSVKRYFHTIFTLTELTACERVFLDWLTEVMGADNSVYINDYEIQRFISTMARTGVIYKSSTIRQAVKGLRATGLLFKTTKSSGLFHVNPIFFAKGDEKTREKNIRAIMEFDVHSDEETNKMKLKIFKDMQKLAK